MNIATLCVPEKCSSMRQSTIVWEQFPARYNDHTGLTWTLTWHLFVSIHTFNSVFFILVQNELRMASSSLSTLSATPFITLLSHVKSSVGQVGKVRGRIFKNAFLVGSRSAIFLILCINSTLRYSKKIVYLDNVCTLNRVKMMFCDTRKCLANYMTNMNEHPHTVLLQKNALQPGIEL